MEQVAIDALEPTALGSDVARRGLTEALDTTNLAINHYRIPPGEGFPAGLHAHRNQEEVFVVLNGAATFETLSPDQEEAREVTVGAGEAVRFAPGEFQSGRNDGEEELVALALGAPRDSENVRLPVDCPDCRHREVRLETGGGGVRFVCPTCDAEQVPAACPECGDEDLRIALGDAVETVVVCEGCGSEFDDPPLQE